MAELAPITARTTEAEVKPADLAPAQPATTSSPAITEQPGATGTLEVPTEDRFDARASRKSSGKCKGVWVEPDMDQIQRCRLVRTDGSPMGVSVPLVLTAVVALPDESEVECLCDQGRYTTASDLRDMVCDEIQLDDEYRAFFSIWVVSGSLRRAGEFEPIMFLCF